MIISQFIKHTFYLLLLVPTLAISQTQDLNYIKNLTYREPTTTTDAAKAQVNVTYFDGLGRPIQQVAGKMSGSGMDIITPIEYDGFGRVAKKYLQLISTKTPYL